MKPIRYTFAFVVSRLTIIVLRVLGRNGTHFPGAVAMRLCPDFIKHLPQPKKLIAITGTNGKTIDTTFVFMKDHSGIVRLVTGIPTKK